MICPHCQTALDLTSATGEELLSEVGRRNRAKITAPRARIERPCVQCAAPLSAGERRKPCPHCGARQPRKGTPRVP
jgi:DNA-directed RNA polymerase subunit RPC12/RpoP